MSGEQFARDDASCRAQAQAVFGPAAAQPANDAAAANFVGGTLLGAAIGALLGAAVGDAGHGAAIGAGFGAIGGGAAAADVSGYSNVQMQAIYDRTYLQCMYARGHRVPAPFASRGYRAAYPVPQPGPPAVGYPPPNAAPPRTTYGAALDGRSIGGLSAAERGAPLDESRAGALRGPAAHHVPAALDGRSIGGLSAAERGAPLDEFRAGALRGPAAHHVPAALHGRSIGGVSAAECRAARNHVRAALDGGSARGLSPAGRPAAAAQLNQAGAAHAAPLRCSGGDDLAVLARGAEADLRPPLHRHLQVVLVGGEEHRIAVDVASPAKPTARARTCRRWLLVGKREPARRRDVGVVVERVDACTRVASRCATISNCSGPTAPSIIALPERRPRTPGSRLPRPAPAGPSRAAWP